MIDHAKWINRIQQSSFALGIMLIRPLQAQLCTLDTKCLPNAYLGRKGLIFVRLRKRGLLYGTDLISPNFFCDIIFSLMRIIQCIHYIYLKTIQFCQVTQWQCGNVYNVINGSVPKRVFDSCLIECMNLYNIRSHTFYEFNGLI